MSTTKDPKSSTPALIVFGKTAMGRPRAAWFSAGDAAVAKWVARRFGLSMLKTRSKAARTVAESLDGMGTQGRRPAGDPIHQA